MWRKLKYKPERITIHKPDRYTKGSNSCIEKSVLHYRDGTLFGNKTGIGCFFKTLDLKVRYLDIAFTGETSVCVLIIQSALHVWMGLFFIFLMLL